MSFGRWLNLQKSFSLFLWAGFFVDVETAAFLWG
jgi:hypothetical protein